MAVSRRVFWDDQKRLAGAVGEWGTNGGHAEAFLAECDELEGAERSCSQTSLAQPSRCSSA